MATPTPSTNTPQKNLHTLSSPAPRSVPPMNFDSPAVLNMLGEGGVGMGISMSGMGMSSLGLTASQLGRADEDERRRRLEGIIALINKRKGRVSEEGISALCRQENVEIMREVQGDGTIVLTLVIGNEAMCDISLLNEEVTSVKLELATDDDDVYKTSGSRILKKSLVPPPGVRRINTTLDRFALNLDKLIKMDKLSAENGGVGCYKAIFSVHASLKKLFEHEKKLALELIGADTPNAVHKAEREVLCKKSGRPRMNAGYCLGLSLEYWMDRRHLVSKRPHNIPFSSAKGKEKEDADLQATLDAYPEDADPDTNKIYSLTIECEGAPSSMHTPIRIPDAGWIAEPIEKDPSAADTAMNNLLLTPAPPSINWLDPKPTYLDSEGDATATTADAAAIPPQTRLPNIRFVAKFNPPLAVPLSLYVSILQSLGQEYNPQDLRATTFVGLALRPDEPDPGMAHSAGGATAEVHSERHVVSVDASGAEHQRLHRNALYVPKLEYARCLESLPFSHPRQLVELLPTLRQHAFATSLLQDVFAARASTSTATTTTTPSSSTPPSPTLTLPPLNVDMSLTHAPPNPRLTLHMPHPSSLTSSSSHTNPPSTTTTETTNTALPTSPTELLTHLLSTNTISASPAQPSPSSTSHPPLKLALDILPNGEVFVAEQNAYGTEGDGDGDGGEKVRRLGRGLEVAGEVGVWAEWVGREVGRGMK